MGKQKKGTKGVGSMGIIGFILQIISDVTSLTNKAVDASDPEHFSEGVHKLNQNIDNTYEKMREIIVNSDSFSAEEKLERLEKLAQSQQAARESSENAIKSNRENVGKVITEVFLALTTCGISYIPKALKGSKKTLTEKSDDILIEGYIPVDDIDETCFYIEEPIND